MKIFSVYNLFGLAVAFLVQTAVVNGNPTAVKITTEFTSSPEPPIEVSRCPLFSTSSPCTCKIDLYYGAEIVCSGSAVNQSSIENTFREIRRVHEIPEDRGISIYEFRVEFTSLTQLDLAPFYGTKIDYLEIWRNDNLTKLATSGNPRHHGSIQVGSLQFLSSPLNREGFGDALKYFSNQMDHFYAGALSLNDDDFTKEDDAEFLPGLSAHTNLQYLDITNCNISGRLIFDTLIPKQLQNLEYINLDSNRINEIGENVFDFEGREDYLYINLGSNKLNETGFHPNSGIARAGRQTNLLLYYNQISTLPFEIFEAFLDAHPKNIIRLQGNPLICDQRVSWIKSRREEFQSRVRYAYCSNDKGHTVFDSDLIP